LAGANRGTTTSSPHRYSARELEIFASVQKSHFRAPAATSIGRYLFFAVAVWGLSWGAIHSLEALRGAITYADIHAGFSLSKSEKGGSESVQLVRTVFEGLSGLGNVVLFILYRMMRKRQDTTVLQLGPFREMYEALMDPKRTTSGLRRDGHTPPEENS
jgi:hypothetical protein